MSEGFFCPFRGHVCLPEINGETAAVVSWTCQQCGKIHLADAVSESEDTGMLIFFTVKAALFPAVSTGPIIRQWAGVHFPYLALFLVKNFVFSEAWVGHNVTVTMIKILDIGFQSIL
ncbi:hypothetical protein SY1_24050 [Fretibacterium fastidiosum]|uniref:Uncharacterized protein n=1 Tax=Fretibacterium fastidiosum TaxID=651822 RepID=A0AB94IZ60_9BACT|nr:hypothetical protein SY1_24050 [Fretibacterium fastidiosum]